MSVWKDTCRLSKAGSVGGMGAAAFAGLIVLAGFVAPAACNLGAEGNVGAGELVARFRAHEREFAALAGMLEADGGAVVDVRSLVALDASRRASYENLLGKIGVADVTYVPGSRAIAVWVSDAGVPPSTYYLYANGALTKPPGLDGPNQLHGPGLYFTTREQPLGGGWFLRREVGMPVCFAAY